MRERAAAAIAILAAGFLSGFHPVPAASSPTAFLLEPIDAPVAVVPPFATTPFRMRLTHLAATHGCYTCRAFRDIPAAWFSSLCSESQCVFDSLDVCLSPGEAETLWVDVFPFGVPGSGTMELRVRAHDPPFTTESRFVGALSSVTRVVVDDDAGAGYEDFAAAAFTAIGTTAGVWPVWIAAPRATDLAGMSAVMWITGDATQETLTAEDQDELTAYLDAGGRLLVSGQGLGADIGATPFYRERLGASFVADNAATSDVTGVSGDPIGDGLAFAIAGGDGANNQTSPDVIAARDAPVLRYGNGPSGPGAAARVEGGGIFRTVYLAFGFEGIAAAGTRTDVLGRILAWLEATPPVGVTPDGAPGGAPRVMLAPNPLAGGPARIVITAPGAHRAAIEIADAMGRAVAHLTAHAAGMGNLIGTWNGDSTAGRRVPSGVYFLRIEPDHGPPAEARLVVAP